MKLGNANWACDRCADEFFNVALVPQPVEVFAAKRELCPKCVTSHRNWWYEPTRLAVSR